MVLTTYTSVTGDWIQAWRQPWLVRQARAASASKQPAPVDISLPWQSFWLLVGVILVHGYLPPLPAYVNLYLSFVLEPTLLASPSRAHRDPEWHRLTRCLLLYFFVAFFTFLALYSAPAKGGCGRAWGVTIVAFFLRQALAVHDSRRDPAAPLRVRYGRAMAGMVLSLGWRGLGIGLQQIPPTHLWSPWGLLALVFWILFRYYLPAVVVHAWPIEIITLQWIWRVDPLLGMGWYTVCEWIWGTRQPLQILVLQGLALVFLIDHPAWVGSANMLRIAMLFCVIRLTFVTSPSVPLSSPPPPLEEKSSHQARQVVAMILYFNKTSAC